MESSRNFLVVLALLNACASGTELSVNSQADADGMLSNRAEGWDPESESSPIACADKAIMCWAKRSQQRQSASSNTLSRNFENGAPQVTVEFDRYPGEGELDRRSACADKPIACKSIRGRTSTPSIRPNESGVDIAGGKGLSDHLDSKDGRVACTDKPVLCLKR